MRTGLKYFIFALGFVLIVCAAAVDFTFISDDDLSHNCDGRPKDALGFFDGCNWCHCVSLEVTCSDEEPCPGRLEELKRRGLSCT